MGTKSLKVTKKLVPQYKPNISLANTDYAIDVPNYLNPREMRLIESYVGGRSIGKAETDNGFKGTGCVLKRILEKPAGKQYYVEVVEQYRNRQYARLDVLVRELQGRLPTAEDKDAVKIVEQISKLMGFVDSNDSQPKIEISFGKDPWAKQQN